MESSIDPDLGDFVGSYFWFLIAEIPLTTYPLIIVILLQLIVSALVSGSEVAFFSLKPTHLEQCKNERKVADIAILSLLENPKALLATILILNNLVNVAIVTISTYVTWQIAGKDNQLAIAILTGVVTAAIVFYGEIVPKVFATQRNLSFAKFTSRPLYIANALFKPLAWFLMNMSDFIEKKFKSKGYQVSVSELHEALEITTQTESTEEEREILKGIVSFGTKLVKQVMHSRMDITAFDVELNFHQLMDLVKISGYSRIPIYRNTIDSLEGILYVKDLLPYLEKDENFEWQQLIRRDIFFVPEGKKIDKLLKNFQEKRVHIAIVADEYGGTSGLITLEDIIEEIVGEINDEFDTDELNYKKVDDNTFTFEGKTSLNDFCKIVGVEPSVFESVKGESESLGGLFLEIASKMPRPGEQIEFENFVFTAVSVTKKRIKSIRVFIKERFNKHLSDYLD